MAMVGGTPGKDCGGFCKFCYYKTIDFKKLDTISLGCKYCPPDQIGCDNCHKFKDELNNGFKPASQVLYTLMNILSWHKFLDNLDYNNLRIITASCADIIFYPELYKLVSELKDQGLKVHLGYTSGKGINDMKIVKKLISLGVDEINFSVFSTDPEMRRTWMKDKSPEQSLKALKIFCENMEVNATSVVIPGVINEEEIIRTCSILEDWGVKSFILSRFVNYKDQGLILNYGPVIDGIEPQPYQQFEEMVKRVAREFSIRVIGSPMYDPENNIPYMLSKRENWKYLKRLKTINGEATIITSKLSLKHLKKIFDIIAGDRVNVIAADKDIGDLITQEDLMELDFDEVKEKVIIPGGALVHDQVANKIFNKDKKRTMLRGPFCLFLNDFEVSNKEDVLLYELRSFNALIDKINK